MPTGPGIRYEFTVAAPQAEVWRAWTTREGLQTFFGPAATIELRTFGRFDIHFDPEASAGQKGAEGNMVLAVEPERMLTTTWTPRLNSHPSGRSGRFCRSSSLRIRMAPPA